jgi:hypothetical protein
MPRAPGNPLQDMMASLFGGERPSRGSGRGTGGRGAGRGRRLAGAPGLD